MTRHDRQIATAITVVAFVFFLLSIYGTGRWADFGLNGFTETLGIAFTVFLIDQLLRRREEVRTLPQRLAAFEDVRLLANRRTTFWFQAYMAAVPDALPTHVHQLLSPQSIALVCGHLDMDTQPNVTPSRTWWQHVPEDMESFRASAERVLERYSGILEPRAFLTIHRLLNNTGEPGLVLGILQSDQQKGFPRPKLLGNYLPVMEDHFSALIELIDWLASEKQKLSKITGEKLGEITEVLNGNRPDGVPPCMMEPGKKAAQFHALNEHLQRSAHPTVPDAAA